MNMNVKETEDKQNNLAVIIIGRNEGERLIRSIESVIDKCQYIVYVDSASTDNSLKAAKELGVITLELDMSTPFTAARARNAGFAYLYEFNPEITFVQFVDGDCEVVNGWLQSASQLLNDNEKIAIVCGRNKERHPERTIYNQLCDIEWDTPIGITKSCGGNFMIRANQFKEVEGFNETLIAGEEPELCLRVRNNGWLIKQIDEVMTIHDANMTKFSQWWFRNVRGGHAYAEGAYLHGKGDERFCLVECMRIWVWGFLLPIAIISLSFSSILFILLLLLYPVQFIRIAIRMKPINSISLKYAFFIVLGKFPEVQGQIKFFFSKLTNSRNKIIEYK